MQTRLFRNGFWAICALVAAFAAHAAQAQTAPPLKLGELTLGMSGEETQALFPNTQWLVMRRSPSGKIADMTARDAMQFGGQNVSVAIKHGRYERALDLSASMRAVTAEACLNAARPWFEAARAAAGGVRAPAPLTSTTPGSTTITTQRIEGALIVVPVTTGPTTRTFGEKITLGDGVDALLDARRDFNPWPQARWSRKPPTSFSLTGEIPNQGDHSPFIDIRVDYTNASCTFTADAGVSLPRPPQPTFSFAPEKVRATRSIASRHALMTHLAKTDPAAAPLTAPMTQAMDCHMDRASGEMQHCALPENAPAISNALRVAFQDAAHGFILDTKGEDIDDPQLMRVTIPVTLKPEDARPLDFVSVPQERFGKVTLARAPRMDYRSYPSRAVEKEIEVDVLVKCQVQADFSIICADVRIEDPAKAEHVALFREAALGTARGVLARPELMDGGTSAGAVFEYRAAFRLE